MALISGSKGLMVGSLDDDVDFTALANAIQADQRSWAFEAPFSSSMRAITKENELSYFN